MDKPPGVAEAINWVAALSALGRRPSWSATTSVATLGALAKTPDDRDAGRAGRSTPTRSAEPWRRADSPDPLLAAVDRAAFVVALGERLRRAGVPVTFTAMSGVHRRAGARAAGADVRDAVLAGPAHPGQPRRTTCATFDAVFDAVFRDAVLAVDPQARPAGPEPSGPRTCSPPVAGGAPAPAGGAGTCRGTRCRAASAADDEPTRTAAALPELLPSAVARIADTPFEELDEARAGAARGAGSRRRRPRWPTRRSRRRRVRPSGRRVALRETIAASRRTGWEPMRAAAGTTRCAAPGP